MALAALRTRKVRFGATLLVILAMTLGLMVVDTADADAAVTQVHPFGQKVNCYAKYGTNGGNIVRVHPGAYADSRGNLYHGITSMYWVAITDYYTGKLIWSSQWRNNYYTEMPAGLPYPGWFKVHVLNAWINPGSSAWSNSGFVHMANCLN